MLGNVAILVEDVIAHRRRELILFAFVKDLFDFILRSLGKAPEHFLFSGFQLELRYTVFKLIVAVLLIVVGVDRSIFIQNRDPEAVITLIVVFVITLYLLLNHKAFQRPVFDLHRVGVVIDILTIIHQSHIVCQCDEIVKTDCSVILQCVYLLDMIAFTEVEVILVGIKCNLAVLVSDQKDFFCMICFYPEINLGILAENLELYTAEFLIGVIAVDLDNLEARFGAFSLACAAIVFCFLDGLVSAVDADLVDNLL